MRALRLSSKRLGTNCEHANRGRSRSASPDADLKVIHLITIASLGEVGSWTVSAT